MDEKQQQRVAKSPVVKGNIKIKKEPLSRKFSNVFLSDSVNDVKSYVIFDVILPGIRDLMYSMITNGTDMLIYGHSRHSAVSKRGTDRENYSKISRGNNIGRSSEPVRGNPRNRYSYNDIIFDSRADAREVLDCMHEVLDRFGIVSVADFYELSHAEECSTYTDNKYGWTNLDNAEVVRDRDGFRIMLPKVDILD